MANNSHILPLENYAGLNFTDRLTIFDALVAQRALNTDDNDVETVDAVSIPANAQPIWTRSSSRTPGNEIDADGEIIAHI